jgi:hypothetical protein
MEESRDNHQPSILSAEPSRHDEQLFDAILSHASEDKAAFVAPLSKALLSRGFSLWYDEISLKWGESVRGSIDLGLRKSTKAIVVLSKPFFAKKWTKYELDGLVQRHVAEGGIILPIYHGVNNDQVREFAPSLADIMALSSSLGLDQICDCLVEVLGKGPSVIQPRIGERSKTSVCKKPRLVIDGETEQRIYHMGPHHVEAGEFVAEINSHAFYAPFPYRIAGLREETLNQAKALGHMLMLRGLEGRALPNGDYMIYQYLRNVPAHPEDELCCET